MKYYLIVGEASGDLHASHLMREIKNIDAEAEFRFFGGDNMIAVGGTCVRHYKDTAFMGFLPVLMNLRTIFRNMSLCKKDIMQWQPDVVIPVDYAGFNLSIAKYLQKQRAKNAGKGVPRTFYFIAPKIWAWKEYRIKNFKRDIQEMLCILPFEVDFFEKKHGYPVHYVGNPTADEVRTFRSQYQESREDFCRRHGLHSDKPIVALLAGSRLHEIHGNLPAMIEAAHRNPGYQYVIAGAPSVDRSVYEPYLTDDIRIVHNSTYPLLAHSVAAIVTSGTATLETAEFDVPQVVCYKTAFPRFYRWGFEHVIKCKYISLVNLVAHQEIVQELFSDRFSVDNISMELQRVLPGGEARERMLREYRTVHERLGTQSAPATAAKIIVEKLIEHP